MASSPLESDETSTSSITHAPAPSGPPALSTPDEHIFETARAPEPHEKQPSGTREQLYISYEIERTVREIRADRRKRIALQFPDAMLRDAPWVYAELERGLKRARTESADLAREERVHVSGDAIGEMVPKEAMHNAASRVDENVQDQENGKGADEEEERLFILADTSYGACCVDEVAAEHADADVVVHYGRSCLSATARLPVIYVFTRPPFDLDYATTQFQKTFVDVTQKIILMADLPYCSYLPALATMLKGRGYSSIFVTEVKHDTASLLPNRTVPDEAVESAERLGEWELFHIADPPESLLLILASRVRAFHILPIPIGAPSTTKQASSGDKAASSSSGPARNAGAKSVSVQRTLSRRYGLVTALATVPIFGILINTLSVRNYRDILAHVKQMIARAGKKSYTFVVGKVNAAKVANFSEVGGWVVIGCWESSLFDSREFWKPLITPFELQLALTPESERVWTGRWSSDFQELLTSTSSLSSALNGTGSGINADSIVDNATTETREDTSIKTHDDQRSRTYSGDSEEESEIPEYDLRTGRYVSTSRPLARSAAQQPPSHTSSRADDSTTGNGTVSKRWTRGELARTGHFSPAAEFLRDKRTWRGLGSDVTVDTKTGNEGAVMESGRKGIARGYEEETA